MSNIIPPLLSDSPPPPPPDIDDHEDDEFGDFSGTNNLSYDCDESFSPPNSPLHLPKEPFDLTDHVPSEAYDINSNSKENSIIFTEPPPLVKPKDFHDKRKDSDEILKTPSGTKVVENSVNNYLVERNTCQSFKNETDNTDDVQNIMFKEESLPLCNNTSLNSDASSSTSSHNLKETELTCDQKIDEFVVTNCDIKTTSNQNEASSKSSKNPDEISNGTLSINSKYLEQSGNIDELSDNKLDKAIEDTPLVSEKRVDQLLHESSDFLTLSMNKGECGTQGSISKTNSVEDSSQHSSGSNESYSKGINDHDESESSDQAFNKEISDDFEDCENASSFTLDIMKTADTMSKCEENDITTKHVLSHEHVNDEHNIVNFSLDHSKSISSEASKIPTTNENFDNNYSFGESKSTVTETLRQEPLNLAVNDDDFGDFSTAADNTYLTVETKVNHQGGTSTEVVSTIKDGATSELEKEEWQHNDLENDQFGDFTKNMPSLSKNVPAEDNFDYLAKNKLKQSSVESRNTFQNFKSTLSQKELDDDDDFGDFSSTSHNHMENDFKDVVNEDDFGNFAITSMNVEDQSSKSDFGDYAVSKNDSSPNLSSKNVQKDFENFASFPSTSHKGPDNDFFDDGDDFGDFITPSVSETPEDNSSKILLLNEEQALDKSKEILKEMFPVFEASRSDYEEKDLETNDKIFNQIKSITETHALSFHWLKSASQNLLLKSLNIDSRNIMFGPGWNPSMPRFAANLSVTPLEPIKSEILTPTSASDVNPSNSSQAVNVETPQYDLNDLELMDPLDSLSSKEINNSTEKSSEPSKDITKNIPVFSPLGLQPTILPETNSTLIPTKIEERITPAIQQDDFDDFVSHSTSQSNPPHGHSIILRETHISNKEPSKPDENDIVSYLEPTIVTPELSRKEHKFVEPEDEFEDFQMVVPVSQAPTTTTSETSNTLTVKPLKAVKISVVKSESIPSKSVLGLDFDKRSPIDLKPVQKPKLTNSTSTDDDFGDFTYSLPSQSSSPATITHVSSAPQLTAVTVPLAPTSVLEPLRPSVIHSQVSSSAQISWPDPGITEDEIKRFEGLNYSRVQNNPGMSEDTEPKAPSEGLKNKNVIDPNVVLGSEKKGTIEESYSSPKTRPPSRTLQQSKQSSLGDDEWSDFVSVQNPSPVHKLKNDRDRSSTPDLPLSVLNLGSVQPAKQPIPVITPNGLVQTKLSSNMSLNFPSMMQSNRTYPQPQQNVPVYQPSIISNQYASQAYGGFSNYQAQSSSNTSSKAHAAGTADDDEWSDFVSHQPATQRNAQPRHNQGWSGQSNQFSSWSGITPNIITNPSASFDSFSGSSVQKQAKKLTIPAQNKKGGVQNIAMPDLDFLAPRSRTSNRK